MDLSKIDLPPIPEHPESLIAQLQRAHRAAERQTHDAQRAAWAEIALRQVVTPETAQEAQLQLTEARAKAEAARVVAENLGGRVKPAMAVESAAARELEAAQSRALVLRELCKRQQMAIAQRRQNVAEAQRMLAVYQTSLIEAEGILSQITQELLGLTGSGAIS